MSLDGGSALAKLFARVTVYTKNGHHYVDYHPIDQRAVDIEKAIQNIFEGMEKIIKNGGLLTMAAENVFIGINGSEIESFKVELQSKNDQT